jgi:hypothetical protein
MSGEWKDQINPGTAVWAGVEAYAEERINDLIQVCASEQSSDVQIRQAQAAIAEMRRLLSLPQLIRAEAQIRAQTGARKEY